MEIKVNLSVPLLRIEEIHHGSQKLEIAHTPLPIFAFQQFVIVFFHFLEVFNQVVGLREISQIDLKILQIFLRRQKRSSKLLLFHVLLQSSQRYISRALTEIDEIPV